MATIAMMIMVITQSGNLGPHRQQAQYQTCSLLVSGKALVAAIARLAIEALGDARETTRLFLEPVGICLCRSSGHGALFSLHG